MNKIRYAYKNDWEFDNFTIICEFTVCFVPMIKKNKEKKNEGKKYLCAWNGDGYIGYN